MYMCIYNLCIYAHVRVAIICIYLCIYMYIYAYVCIYLYICVYIYVYTCTWARGRVVRTVQIPLRSIYQECDFLIKLSSEMNPVRGTFGKCLKTMPQVDPSQVREISRRNCTEAVHGKLTILSKRVRDI